MKRRPHLTAGEFELIQVVWQLGEASVRQVWERVRRERPVAYTTVMTVLDKMRRKRVLRQRKQGKAYLYSPAIGREEALAAVLAHVADAYFGGSEREFVKFVSARAAAPEPVAAPTPDAPASREPADATPPGDIDEFLL